MDKKHEKCPQNGFFPYITPQIFFKNRALPLLYPYGAPTSCKKSEKTKVTNKQTTMDSLLRYLKTDRLTDRQRRVITPSEKAGVQNDLTY